MAQVVSGHPVSGPLTECLSFYSHLPGSFVFTGVRVLQGRDHSAPFCEALSSAVSSGVVKKLFCSAKELALKKEMSNK